MLPGIGRLVPRRLPASPACPAPAPGLSWLCCCGQPQPLPLPECSLVGLGRGVSARTPAVGLGGLHPWMCPDPGKAPLPGNSPGLVLQKGHGGTSGFLATCLPCSPGGCLGEGRIWIGWHWSHFSWPKQPARSERPNSTMPICCRTAGGRVDGFHGEGWASPLQAPCNAPYEGSQGHGRGVWGSSSPQQRLEVGSGKKWGLMNSGLFAGPQPGVPVRQRGVL